MELIIDVTSNAPPTMTSLAPPASLTLTSSLAQAAAVFNELILNQTTTPAMFSTNFSASTTMKQLTASRSQQGFFSDEALKEFMDVFSWFFPFLCALAIIFCILNAAVYWQQRAATFALYLVGVDIGDGTCAVMGLLHSLTEFSLTPDAFAPLWIKRYLAVYVAVSFRRAAIVLNALASLERFLAIAFPLKSVGRRMCSSPWLVVIGVMVASLLTHLNLALEYKITEKPGGAGYMMAPTDLKKNNPELMNMWSTVVGIIFGYAPLVAIMVMNTVLLIVLKMHTSSLKGVRRARGTTTSTTEVSTIKEDDSGLVSADTEKVSMKDPKALAKDEQELQKKKAAQAKAKEKENQTTKMVMLFSTVFLAMALPSLLSFSAQNIWDDYSPVGKESNLYKAVSLFSSLTSHFTETALFWVSLSYSRYFRRAVLRLPVARTIFRACVTDSSHPGGTTLTSSSEISSGGGATKGSVVYSQGA